MKVALGTTALLVALAVAFVGFALSQGERDILARFLTLSAVFAVAAFVLFGWSAATWHRQTKAGEARGGAAESPPASEPLSTVLLVFGVVVAFIGLPMLIDGVERLTRSGSYGGPHGRELLALDYPPSEWPWLFAIGFVMIVSALVWKVRLRRARSKLTGSD